MCVVMIQECLLHLFEQLNNFYGDIIEICCYERGSGSWIKSTQMKDAVTKLRNIDLAINE